MSLSKPSIYMICPTIRPLMMMDTVKYWFEKSSKTTRMFAILDVHDISVSGVGCVVGMLKNIECEKGEDIITFVSDDIYPNENWDLEMIKATEDWSGAVMFKDNIRRGNPIFSNGCITFEALKKMNRVFIHPDYYHCWSDNECYDNLIEMGILKDASETSTLEFDHKHFCLGGRAQDSHDIYYHSRFEEGKATYERRKKLTIRQRLELDKI